MMTIFKTRNIPRSGGFTLVETLVAIVVLTIATTAAMSALQIGLRGSGYAKNEITAYYLAEEGIEAVRYIRDTNALKPGRYWLQGIEESPACTAPNARCDVDLTNPSAPVLKLCQSGGCRALAFSQTGPLHYYYSESSSATRSQFTRTITITRRDTSVSPANSTASVTGSDAILVTSEVVWSGAGATNRKVTLQAELYNWQ